MNSAAEDWGPGAFEDPDTGHLALYFNSNRLGGPGGHDVYTSILGRDGTFGPAVLVPELSSSASDTFLTVRPSGREIFLTSNREGGLGGNDLWVASRANPTALWSTPVNLGPSVNSTANDLRAAIPYNRNTLIFFSNRDGGAGGNDLYITTRTPGMRPNIASGGVVNAATYASGTLTRNMIISIFGSDLATVTTAGELTAGSYPTSLFGTRVTFGSSDAQLLYISPLQINAVVPSGPPAGSTNVTVTVDGATSSPQTVTIGAGGL